MRLRAPIADREVLAVPNFADVPRLVEENRRKLDRADVIVGGLPLRELRALARREVLDLANPERKRPEDSDAPLMLAGHQPELSHPGVWAKHFALNGLARKVGGIPLNLVVDNDTLKSASIRLPVWDRDPKNVRLETIAFDAFTRGEPYESRPIADAKLFRSFPERLSELTANWGFKPLAAGRWPPDVVREAKLDDYLLLIRILCEEAWGCENLELRVSALSQTEAFRRFASHLLADLPRFRAAYNAAIREYRAANRIRSASHPAPELGENDIPFWVFDRGGRRGSGATPFELKHLRPRALTLTLFARLCVGDFFVHGIGGGKYDEVTDAIIRDYFGIDPPAYQVLSATLHLPLPGFDTTAEMLEQVEWAARDIEWNPQRQVMHLTMPPEVRRLIDEKAAVAASEPARGNRAARREWFRRLQRLTGELRNHVERPRAIMGAELLKARSEVAANAILKRRDYAWVLYPEETLRPFLQQFLHV